MPTTARFSQVLARSGAPHVHLTWTTPTRDKTLRSALAHTRLMTVHQNARGQTKDFGLVGLHPGKTVQYLIFPKSLRPFAGKRVVGIDYSAIAENSLAPAPATLAPPKQKPPAARSRPASPPPKAEIVSFAPPPAEETKPSLSSAPSPRTHRTARAPKLRPTPATAPPWREEVRRAAADLKRGKTVAAYDRLQRLLGDNSSAD